MGNRHLYKIGCFHTLGTLESERLKVTALNLFHPIAFSPLENICFFHIATQPLEEEERPVCRPPAYWQVGGPDRGQGRQGWGEEKTIEDPTPIKRD